MIHESGFSSPHINENSALVPGYGHVRQKDLAVGWGSPSTFDETVLASRHTNVCYAEFSTEEDEGR